MLSEFIILQIHHLMDKHVTITKKLNENIKYVLISINREILNTFGRL